MKRVHVLLIALALGAGVGIVVPIVHDAEAGNRHSHRGHSHVEKGPIPFQETGLDQGEGTATVEFIDEVPDGKRLVMQHVSLSGVVPSPEVVDVSCSLTVDDGETPSFELVRLSLRVTTDRGATDSYVAEGPITLYADAGDAVRATCRGFDLNNDPASQISLSATLVGSLVDAIEHH